MMMMAVRVVYHKNQPPARKLAVARKGVAGWLPLPSTAAWLHTRQRQPVKEYYDFVEP